jgi:hypothetical protein
VVAIIKTWKCVECGHDNTDLVRRDCFVCEADRPETKQEKTERDWRVIKFMNDWQRSTHPNRAKKGKK